MKTAMQELIDWIECDDNNVYDIYEILDMAKELLEKEKEQIMNAYDNGMYGGTYAVDKDGNEYYNQTYNQNK